MASSARAISHEQDDSEFLRTLFVRNGQPLRICLPKVIENGDHYVALIKDHGGVVGSPNNNPDVVLMISNIHMKRFNFLKVQLTDIQWLEDCADMGWLLDWNAYALPRDDRKISDEKNRARSIQANLRKNAMASAEEVEMEHDELEGVEMDEIQEEGLQQQDNEVIFCCFQNLSYQIQIQNLSK